MNAKVVVTSYLIIGGSIGLVVLSYFLQSGFGYGYYSYFPFGFFPTGILILVAVAGLILGPYFALAGFIAKERSIWFEANRMIHEHISIPIIGGLVLYFSSFRIYETLTGYVVVVFLGTLISVMASKNTKPAGPAQESTKS